MAKELKTFSERFSSCLYPNWARSFASRSSVLESCPGIHAPPRRWLPAPLAATDRQKRPGETLAAETCGSQSGERVWLAQGFQDAAAAQDLVGSVEGHALPGRHGSLRRAERDPHTGGTLRGDHALGVPAPIPDADGGLHRALGRAAGHPRHLVG